MIGKPTEKFSNALKLPRVNEFRRIWANLFNIYSTNPGVLDVVYSPNGIAIQPISIGEYPFRGEIQAIVDNDDGSKTTTIVVGKNRGLRNYRFRDTITLGLLQLHKRTSETVDVDESSYVYYSITGETVQDVDSTSDGVDPFTATLSASRSYPTQINGTVNIVLGKVLYPSELNAITDSSSESSGSGGSSDSNVPGSDADAITFQQYQFGDIHLHLRFGAIP